MQCKECSRQATPGFEFCFRHEPKRNKGGSRRPLPRVKHDRHPRQAPAHA